MIGRYKVVLQVTTSPRVELRHQLTYILQATNEKTAIDYAKERANNQGHYVVDIISCISY